MENLVKNSQELCSIGNTIIDDVKINGVFSQLGKVEIIGSLRLGLMYRRDIDLFVLSDVIDKTKAIEVTKQLLDSGLFQTVGFADYQTFPAHDMPLGFFFELIVAREGKNWKFDVWYLRPEEKYAHMVFDAIQKFEPILAEHPEKKELILKIKQAYFNGVKYKDNVKSIDIYSAVLEKEIISLEDFRNKIKQR